MYKCTQKFSEGKLFLQKNQSNIGFQRALNKTVGRAHRTPGHATVCEDV